MISHWKKNLSYVLLKLMHHWGFLRCIEWKLVKIKTLEMKNKKVRKNSEKHDLVLLRLKILTVRHAWSGRQINGCWVRVKQRACVSVTSTHVVLYYCCIIYLDLHGAVSPFHSSHPHLSSLSLTPAKVKSTSDS